jgi:hypothetical protein
MDIWQSADPGGKLKTGWLGRAAAEGDDRSGRIPILHIGPSRLPLAVNGAPGSGAVTVNSQDSFRLELGQGDAPEQEARRRLLAEVAADEGMTRDDDLLSFVQRRQVQTFSFRC